MFVINSIQSDVKSLPGVLAEEGKVGPKSLQLWRKIRVLSRWFQDVENFQGAYNIIYTQLRKDWFNKIQLLSMKSAIPHVLGCTYEDLMSLGEECLLKCLNTHGSRGRKDRAFSTLFYTVFNNTIATAYRLNGVTGSCKYRACVGLDSNFDVEGFEFENKRLPCVTPEYELTKWFSSEEKLLEYLTKEHSEKPYVIQAKAKDRSMAGINQLTSLDSRPGDFDDEYSSHHVEGIDTISDKAVDNVQLRLELMDLIKKNIKDRPTRKAIWLIYSGYNFKTKDAAEQAKLCKKLDCTPEKLKQIYQTTKGKLRKLGIVYELQTK